MPHSPAHPCRVASCPELVTRARPCPIHGKPYRTHAETPTERGYGYQWQQTSKAVLKRDDGICFYCGGTATTADHLVSKARGGTDDMSNLVAACVPCNSRKGAR